MPGSPVAQVPPSPDYSAIALAVVDHIPGMVAYWDASERCRFVNAAYREWFGRTRPQLIGTTLKELLGPLYELNLPHIRAVLAGRQQVFERAIPDPVTGIPRDSLATYTPDLVDGKVVGFYVHVADATTIKERERELARVVAERDKALAEARTLRGLLPVCANCKSVRDEGGRWVRIEHYIEQRTDAAFTHSLCPTCSARLYPEPSEEPVR